MTILVAGQNDKNQISVSENQSIFTPINIGINFTDVISFSVYDMHAVVVLEGGVPSAIGDNEGCVIYANLKRNLKYWQNFSIIEDGNNYLVESAVCGSNYTLYLVKESSNNESKYLAYVQKNKKNGHPYFLNMYGSHPISIYGGSDIAAAIDERGAIHIIKNTITSTPFPNTKILYLPFNSLAISVAFEKDNIIFLSSLNQVFEANLNEEKIRVNRVNELKNKTIKLISGTYEHCIAVCTDGTVFCRGNNDNGQLGLGNKHSTKQFSQIMKFQNQEISYASAGKAFHSLFINNKGKVYSSGHNGFGENLLNNLARVDNLSPCNTIIPKACFV